MNNGEKLIYEFEQFRLDEGKRLLFDVDGAPVSLMPKAFDILSYLVRHSGEVVEKDDLMTAIWPDTIVEENNLTQNISALRRALGEKHRENRFIATVPGRGYKFVAEVIENPISSIADPNSDREAKVEGLGPEIAKKTARRAEDEKPSRFWLAGFAAIVLFVLSSMGFLYWRESAGQANGVSIRSIAVLPFKPMAAENRDESLEMGMADTLISKLNGGDQLAVRHLSAVRRFNSLDQDPLEAGRLLGVEAVLDGNIQTAGDRIRVSAKLIRVADGKQLWAGQFDERSADIFELQDSISERVASALKITLSGRGSKRYTESVDAYQLYMKGNFHTSRLILPEVQKGIAYYEQAIAVDSSYAMAYVGIANACRAMVLTNDARPAEIMPKARTAALKAIELDDTLAGAHTALANMAFWYDWDWPAAEKHLMRALELDPNSAQTRFFYAHLLSNTGRHEEALAEIKRARELDPVNLATNALEGQILFFAGKEDEALSVLKSTAEMEPNFWLAPLFMSRIYLKKGMYDEAIAVATKARDITHGNAEATATIAYALAKSGKSAEAMAILKELEDRAATHYVASYALAQIYNGLGEKEKTFDLLEKAFAHKDALMVFLKVEPKWDNLRSEPRFVELMKRMNFE